MNRYLLDSNHLSAYLDRQPTLTQRVDTALRAGDRFGICLPVLCEYRAGIRLRVCESNHPRDFGGSKR